MTERETEKENNKTEFLVISRVYISLKLFWINTHTHDIAFPWLIKNNLKSSSVQSNWIEVVSDSLQPRGLQHARSPCPAPTPRVHSNSCPLSQWCHPTISSSLVLFSSCPQSFPASGSFQMSQFFVSGGQIFGFSFSISSVQFISFTQSCLTLCDPMNHSTPGLPVHHQLSEFTQTHAHRVSDATQPSHPLSSPSLPAPNSS